MKSARQHLHSLLLIAAIQVTSGCVAIKGSDFGHWAFTAERRQLVRTSIAANAQLPDNSSIAVLPPVGEMTSEIAERLRNQLVLDLQDYLVLNLITPSFDITDSPLFKKNNLVPASGPNLKEIAGTGEVLDASHVLCIDVTDYHCYSPQRLRFTAWLVRTSDAALLCKISATLDASEQQTVIAVRNHLQSRRARSFSSSSLDIMLESPREFIDFVCAYSAKHISEQIISAGLIPAARKFPIRGKAASHEDQSD